ncbi:AI-2E family transporter [Lactonifactor longoviformis]|uniref:Predicted PurR-regulated permease PerM n=3 Tax=Lactonifactor TaxID=420345 RepID=A0A1M4ZM44_9CLOT|nr:AI-2E family transporter [Lactonifactor longoviformis]SHF18882.1 Predicted PurR-regulated permease PerM [Lactonifactor longoviformis DSM 17459]
MKFRWDNKYLHWGITAFLVICASLLFYFGIFHMNTLLHGIHIIKNIMMPVICGAVIAYLLSPIVNFLEHKCIFEPLERKKISLNRRKQRVIRYVCVFLALIFAGTIIYTLIAMIVPSIIDSIINIINNSPRYIQNIEHWIERLLEDNPDLEATAFDMFTRLSSKAEVWLTQDLLPQLKDLLQQLSSGIFDVLIFLKNILIGAIISVYLIADKEGFIGQGKMFLYSILPLDKANHMISNLRFVHKTFGGFISGKIIDSFIIGILCYIGTSLIGTPYAILVSVIVGITNVIPFFGPYLGAVPCAFLILLVNPMQCLYFIIFILILQQFDGNILGPKILGESTGLSSFMVIVAILLFGGVFGILGMFIGVPVMAVIYAAFKSWRSKKLTEKSLPPDEASYMEMDCIDEATLQPVPCPETAKGRREEKMKEEK